MSRSGNSARKASTTATAGSDAARAEHALQGGRIILRAEAAQRRVEMGLLAAQRLQQRHGGRREVGGGTRAREAQDAADGDQQKGDRAKRDEQRRESDHVKRTQVVEHRGASGFSSSGGLRRATQSSGAGRAGSEIVRHAPGWSPTSAWIGCRRLSRPRPLEQCAGRFAASDPACVARYKAGALRFGHDPASASGARRHRLMAKGVVVL